MSGTTAICDANSCVGLIWASDYLYINMNSVYSYRKQQLWNNTSLNEDDIFPNHGSLQIWLKSPRADNGTATSSIECETNMTKEGMYDI
jgi:hypothetical protein